MKLFSCWNCGVVLDADVVLFDKMLKSYDYEEATEVLVGPYTECPVCEEHNKRPVITGSVEYKNDS
jgi:hypothetical protein